MTVWIDVDNPPQVQYLAPFRAAFEAAGESVVLTSRDLGITRELLDARGERHVVVGAGFGRSRIRKATGVLRRMRALERVLRSYGRPELLLSSSRSSALAARRLGVPAFVVCDYEHAELGIYRRTGCAILHPDVIDAAVFTRLGFPSDHLLPFAGLKEDISLAGAAAVPDEPPALPDDGLLRVLFRPPAQESHYHRHESSRLAEALLARLAGDERVRVVYSPRSPSQVALLEGQRWRHEPVVLRRPSGFLALLQAVDVVVSGGGTMLREAAYLGTPAVSIFRSELGAVDRRLAAEGRLHLVSELDELRLEQLERLPPLTPNGSLVHELAARMLARVRGTG